MAIAMERVSCKVSFPDGTTIEGTWLNNRLNGKGEKQIPNGDMYTGNFKDDEFSGHGIYVSGNGTMYDGSWERNEMHGRGTMKFHSGDDYVGEYVNGKMHGKATCVYLNGNGFIGTYANDKQVSGVFMYASGDVFEGEFQEDGQSFGKGEVRLQDGTVVPLDEKGQPIEIKKE
eukprot:gene28176-34992_t